MAKSVFKGIKNVIEGSFTAETGYMYFVRQSTDTTRERGYVLFNGKKYGNVTGMDALPSVTSSDNGKALMVVNGTWVAATPTVVYTGNSAPQNSLGNDGDIYLQTD